MSRRNGGKWNYDGLDELGPMEREGGREGPTYLRVPATGRY